VDGTLRHIINRLLRIIRNSGLGTGNRFKPFRSLNGRDGDRGSEDRDPGPPQAGLVILPGLAALADARPTPGDFDGRLRHAAPQPHARVGGVFTPGQVRHPSAAGQFLNVIGDPPEHPDYTALFHGNVIRIRQINARPEIHHHRLPGDEGCQPCSAGNQRRCLLGKAVDAGSLRIPPELYCIPPNAQVINSPGSRPTAASGPVVKPQRLRRRVNAVLSRQRARRVTHPCRNDTSNSDWGFGGWVLGRCGCCQPYQRAAASSVAY